MYRPLGLALAASILGACCSWTQPAPHGAADLAEGEKLYKFHCAFCHGRGDDGFAANLVQPNLRHAPNDIALTNIIRNGLPGTDMPSALGLTDAEIAKVAAYVRSLGRTAPQKVEGDAGRGRTIYTSKGGCANCHMVNGAGGRTGPDLSAIGAVRSPSNLRSSITDPDAALHPSFVNVRAALKSGTNVAGVRLNEDTFSIQIRDMRGRIHSLDKSEITKLDKGLTKSTMPSFKGRLTDAELNDLVAYLFSLRGGM